MNTLLYIPTFFGMSIEVYFILLLLGILTFFFWRSLLKKFIKADKTRKLVTWTVTIVSTPLIYAGLIILWVLSMSYHPDHDFDKEKWFNDKEKRYELSEDIIDSEMLIGKTKTQVQQLLGNEDNAKESNNWSYYLGFRPGFFTMDPDVLSIEFKNGKVVNVEQHGT